MTEKQSKVSGYKPEEEETISNHLVDLGIYESSLKTNESRREFKGEDLHLIIENASEIQTHRSLSAANGNILAAAKGGSIVFGGKLYTYVCRIIMTILMARILGAEQYGLYNLALVAASIAGGLAVLGLDTGLVRYIAIFASRRDEARMWGALQIGVGIPTIVSVFMGISLFTLANPIAVQLFHEPRLVPLLRLASLAVPILTLIEVMAAATQGFKKMQYTTIAQDISQPTIRLTLMVVLAIVGLSAAGAVTAFISAVFVTFVMLLYFLNKLFPLKRPLRTAQRNIKEMCRFSFPAYLSDLILTFRSNIQTMLLGTLHSVTNVGVYAVASHVDMIGGIFHRAIIVASRPIIAELHDKGEREQLRHFYQTTTKWTFTLNLPLLLITVLFPVQILSIFGKSFVDGSLTLIILAWASMVDAGTGICGTVLDMTGNTNWKLFNSIVRLALSLTFNFLLIPEWGVVGAAVAALAAAITINLLRLLQVFVFVRLLPYNASIIKPVIAGLVALMATLGMSQLFPSAANYVYTAINMVILLAVYISVTLLLGLSLEERVVLMYLRRRASTLLSRS